MALSPFPQAEASWMGAASPSSLTAGQEEARGPEQGGQSHRICVCGGLGASLPRSSASWWVTHGAGTSHSYRGMGWRVPACCSVGPQSRKATRFDFCPFRQIVNVFQGGEQSRPGGATEDAMSLAGRKICASAEVRPCAWSPMAPAHVLTFKEPGRI